MGSESILIAETDQVSMYALAEVLSDHIPRVVIDTCTTLGQLLHKLERCCYDTVAVSPMLIHPNRFLKHQEWPQSSIPLLMTVCQSDLVLAHTAFAGNVFDLIVKPIVPQDAAHTVRLALWHNKLQKLLALKKLAATRVGHRSEGSRADRKAQEDFLRMLETTYQTLKTSYRLLLNIEEKSSLHVVAASVQQRAKQLALDRLLNMYQEGSTH